MWLPEDTALALAWQEEKDGECRGCGAPLDETLSKTGRFLDHYQAEPVTCMRCAAKEHAADIRRDQFQGQREYGLLWTVTEKS